MNVILRILPYIIDIISGIILASAIYMINKLRTQRETQQKKEEAAEEAISAGVQALLREAILSAYNKYTKKGYCPIYAKESLKHAYTAYHALGGNDVASELYNDLIHMPQTQGNNDEYDEGD